MEKVIHTDTVSTNNFLYTGTIPLNHFLFTGSLLMNVSVKIIQDVDAME